MSPATAEEDIIRVVWGTGSGPTALAAYDAALAGAGVENYNLVTVSSIVPANVTVESVGTAPDLGPVGNRLTVVEARATVGADGGEAAAGLAWAVGPGPGLFYEEGGTFDRSTCRRRLDDGLAAGRDLRDWPIDVTGQRIVTVRAPETGFASTVVLGVYGRSESIL